MNAFVSHDVLELPGIVMLLDRTGIDSAATSQGNNVTTWDDRVSGIGFEDLGTTVPTLNLNGGLKEVRFQTTDGMYTVTEPSELDFIMGTNDCSFVFKIGATVTTQGTLLAKSTNGTEEMQFQCTIHNTGVEAMGNNFGSDGAAAAFSRSDTAAAMTSGDVLIWTVDSSSSTGCSTYKNGVFEAANFYSNSDGTTNVGVGGSFYNISNNHPVYLGCRRNNADTSIGFSGAFDLAYIAVYNRILTTDEITHLTNNLQNI